MNKDIPANRNLIGNGDGLKTANLREIVPGDAAQTLNAERSPPFLPSPSPSPSRAGYQPVPGDKNACRSLVAVINGRGVISPPGARARRKNMPLKISQRLLFIIMGVLRVACGSPAPIFHGR